jgi:predicted RNase H-like HicB family nuclease
MLTEYIKAAMRRATYEILEDDGTFYGHIPECPGVWANEPTLEACREELASVLDGWIILGIALHHDFPVLDGIEIVVPKVPAEAA